MLPAGGSWLRGLRAVFGGNRISHLTVRGELPRALWPSPRMRRRTRSNLGPPRVGAGLPTTGPRRSLLLSRAGGTHCPGSRAGHTADLGDGLLEQLQLFGDDFQAGAAGHPCDVPARAREARDESGANRIANGNHDDGDRLGGVPGCRHSLRPLRYDEVHLEPDQLGRQVGQPVDPTLRISIVDDNILALNPPELAQPLPERVEQGRPIGRGRQPKETYPRHLARLLPPRRQRPRRRAAEQRDELAALHSITSSAAT